MGGTWLWAERRRAERHQALQCGHEPGAPPTSIIWDKRRQVPAPEPPYPSRGADNADGAYAGSGRHGGGWLVYGLVQDGEVVYVGQTGRGADRYWEHREGEGHTERLANVIEQHGGYDSLGWAVLDTADSESEARALEHLYIQEYSPEGNTLA